MADERIELTEATEVINGLSSPTDEQFMQALRGYSDTGVALAAARLALESGGGAVFAGWTQADSPAAVNTEGGTLTFFSIDPADYAATFDYSATDEWAGAIRVRVQDVAALAGTSWVMQVVNEEDATTTFQLDAKGAAAIQESPDGGSDSASWYWRSADGDVVWSILTGQKKLFTDGEIGLNDQKITGLATPTDDTDAANKAYVDAGGGGGGAGFAGWTETGDPADVDSNGGTLALGDVGFFGEPATSQPAAPTTLNELITSLTTLGLVAA